MNNTHWKKVAKKQAKDAYLVDSTDLDIEGVLSAIKDIIAKKVSA